MAIAVVNSSSAVGAGASTSIAAPATSLTAGNVILVGIRRGSNNPLVLSVTDTAGNIYRNTQAADNTSSSAISIWYASNVLGNGANVVTATFNSVSNRSITTVQISGLADFPLDTWNISTSVTSATPTTAALTTTVADEILVVFGENDVSGAAWSASSGYTLAVQDASNFQGVSYKIVSAIQTGITPSITSTDSTNPKVAVAVTLAVPVTFPIYQAGVILVADADSVNGRGGVALDSTSGATTATRLPLGAFSGRGSGEGGAQLSNGTFLVSSKGGTADTLHAIQIYDSTLTELSNTAPFSATNWDVFSPAASDFTGLFWMSKLFDTRASPSQVRSITPAGTLGGTTYTLDINNLRCMGVSQDDATLLYAGESDGAVIKTWNLTGNTAGGTFLTAEPAVAWGQDLMVIPGTSSFVVLAQPLGGADPNYVLRRYSTLNGSLISSFGLTGNIGDFSGARLSIDQGSPALSIWIRTYADGTGDTTAFLQMSLQDGSTIASFTLPMNNGGTGGGNLSNPPLCCPFFGWSNNTPSPTTLRPPWPLVPPFVPAGGPAGSGGLQTVPQRRLRVAPHLSAEQFNIFYDQFTLDLQVGNGLLVGQGVTPQIMLRMSDDGGYTWSDEILLDSGAQGQYLTRVTANGLGMARDRVFEISTSDPVAWSIISAFLQTRKGRW